MTPADGGSGVIEVLNRSGQVQQRIPWAGEALRVGRAYDNDVIIGDPFLCPHHARLEQAEAGRVRVIDLDSVNGTWVRRGRRRVREHELADGELVQLGHSQLRWCSPAAAIAPTWRDPTRRGLARWFGRPWLTPLAVLLCMAALLLNDLGGSTGPVRLGVLASNLVYPVFGIMLWAGFWALLNRLFSHRALFATHLGIATSGLLALLVAGQAVPLAGFALGWDEWVGPVSRLAQGAILAVVLFLHLQFATHGKPHRQALGSMALAAALVGAPALGQWLQQRDAYSSLPRLQPLLKPPAFRLREGDSPAAFFAAAEDLRERADAEAAEEP